MLGAHMHFASPVNLVPHRLLDMPLGVEGVSGCGSEKRCRFVDDMGKIHKFTFYTPPTFSLTGKRWPLLLFLHGSQGGTVIGSRLAAQRFDKELKYQPGLEFAGDHFVMICPKCEWKWNGTPNEWILQLVRYFLPAKWCDTTRIFGTGLSMGGMGLWELASASDGLFTAIAPVGAYHRAERREQIADGLTNTPIFIVSSPSDKHCPIAPEVELWEELSKRGNKPTVKQHVPGGHGDLYKQAFARDTDLWEWFLDQ